MNNIGAKLSKLLESLEPASSNKGRPGFDHIWQQLDRI